MKFSAPLSTNTTGIPRKINPDDLDAIMDVPLVDGRWLEMPGRQAIEVFNACVVDAFDKTEG